MGSSIKYTHKPVQERHFEENLNEKYSGSKFKYIEEEVDPEAEKEKDPLTKEKEEAQLSMSLTNGFLFFVKYIFPYLLGLVVIYIILKTFIGVDVDFWKSNHKNKSVKKDLVYEDEIDKHDYEALLQKALKQKNYRIAIRYYYLITLQLMADKNLIEPHKDKTNADYLFEFQSHELNKDFYHLSYIFSYVWYGEFLLDEFSFKTAEQKYQSFRSKLK